MKIQKGARCQGPKANEVQEEEVMASQPEPLQSERSTELQIAEALEQDTTPTIGNENDMNDTSNEFHSAEESTASRDALMENKDNEVVDSRANDNNTTDEEKENED